MFFPSGFSSLPSSCMSWDQLQSRRFFEGQSNSSVFLQVYLTPFNWVEISLWWCRGKGRLALSKPFSVIFFKVPSVGSSIEAKVANSASWVKTALNTWANKCCQNFTASEGTVRAGFTKTTVWYFHERSLQHGRTYSSIKKNTNKKSKFRNGIWGKVFWIFMHFKSSYWR